MFPLFSIRSPRIDETDSTPHETVTPMKTLSLILALTLVSLTPLLAEEKDAAQVAQAFFDGYYKVLEGTPKKYVTGSANLSKGFKAAYSSLLKQAGENLDWDPILCGNDFPDKGYKAGEPVICGDAAMVVMASRDPNFEGTILVQAIKVDDKWVINGINDLVGQSLSAGY